MTPSRVLRNDRSAITTWPKTSFVGAGILPRFVLGISLFLAAVMTLPLSARADEQIQSANRIIDSMILDIEGYLISDGNDIESRTQITKHILDSYFDLPSIARFSVGPYWRSANSAEKAEFNRVVRQVMIRTIVRNFDQLIGLKFSQTETVSKGDKMVLVRGNFIDVKGVRPPISVAWRVVTPPGGEARVLDIELENISMLVTQKQENIAVIRKNGGKFSALIAVMKQQGGK